MEEQAEDGYPLHDFLTDGHIYTSGVYIRGRISSPLSEMSGHEALIIIVIIIIVGFVVGAVGVYLYVRNRDKSSPPTPTPTPTPPAPTPTPPAPPSPSSGTSGFWASKSAPTSMAGVTDITISTQHINTRPPLLAYATPFGLDTSSGTVALYKMSDFWNVFISSPNNHFIYTCNAPGGTMGLYASIQGSGNLTQSMGKYREVIYWNPNSMVLDSMWATGLAGDVIRMLTIVPPSVRPPQCNQNGWITIHVLANDNRFWVADVSAEMGLGATIVFNQQVVPAKAWVVAWNEESAEQIFSLVAGTTSPPPPINPIITQPPTTSQGNVFLAPDGVTTFTIPTTITAGLNLCS